METFEKNNVTITLNYLYAKKEKIYPAYVSEHSTNLEKQVILLMIPNGKGWHFFELKKLSALLRRIAFIHLEQKENVDHIEKCVKIKAFVM